MEGWPEVEPYMVPLRGSPPSLYNRVYEAVRVLLDAGRGNLAKALVEQIASALGAAR